ncbi:transporter substrate-binding domain-containing protein [Paraburkholderia tropica]|uniref:transporter substrate-binding domain-containing protein n=1 Tax=Paraburkholderia tropica TaxID=92647 RepID=UPI002AB7A1FF|nr:transporter substrate-binding domain-containing protein [Paraburkholderia tropica]
MKFITRLASLVTGLGLVGMMATSSAYAEDTLARIHQEGTVKIGILTDFPPYGFVGPDLQPQGLDIDMTRLIASKLGVKLKFVTLVSANRIAALQADKVDILVASMAKSPEREKVVDFTVPYAPYYQAVYGSKSITVKSFADLAGKTVAVAKGSTQDDNLQKVAPPTTNILRFESSTDAIQAVLSGQSQFIAMGSSVVGPILKQHPDANIEYKLLLKDSPNYIAVRKGDTALLNKLNEIIRGARADGTLEKMSQKWLGEGVGKLAD